MSEITINDLEKLLEDFEDDTVVVDLYTENISVAPKTAIIWFLLMARNLEEK